MQILVNSLSYLKKTHSYCDLTAKSQVVLHQKFGKQRYYVKQKPSNYATFTIILINMIISPGIQELTTNSILLGETNQSGTG